MDPLDECSVLLPTATLEDFPVGGPDADARSLLAGWTVLWHPKLLALTEQMPTWYRADAPPTPDGPRVVVVPDSSLGQIPADFRRKCDANPSCVWVTGSDRSEMIRALGIDPSDPQCSPLEVSGRPLAVEDFYAAGYLSLQIQIMTRRLRYTSNLDELHLQNRITTAAKAFCERDPAATAEALHDVFDCLSEERDHYFSSDPHLIDLTLLTPEVLDSAIDSGWLDRIRRSAPADDEGNGFLGTARNVLLDGQVAAHLCRAKTERQDDRRYHPFCELLHEEMIGWAGGGAATDSDLDCLDAMTMASARHFFESGTQLALQAVGVAPKVYARLQGMTPVDLIPALAALGYDGVIPLDFAAGTGFGDESKVIVSGGGSELEALTAKPIDAASDAAFLSIGAQLGEAIDGGEIATALLAHWPDRVCDSFLDLCRAATWSVALGRFWTLDRYFTAGERPYHHGSLDAVSPRSASIITDILSDQNRGVTLQSLADAFANSVRGETRRTTEAIAFLAKPGLLDKGAETSKSDDVSDTRALICEAIGVKPRSVLENPTSASDTTDVVCFNPQGVATRGQVVLSGGGPPNEAFIYSATDAGNGACCATFDVPAMGFTRLSASHPIKSKSILKRLLGGRKGIAESELLRNEFMAVSLDEVTGGIAGIYSASRGNRLSMKLVGGEDLVGGKDGGTMVCHRMTTDRSDSSVGVIQVQGDLQDSGGHPVASFAIRYRLDRGSRLLHVRGTLEPKTSQAVRSTSDVWKNCFAIRTAVAGEAAIFRALVRDKVHSTSSSKVVAPLGVLIDEAEKQTLVVGHGLPLHRKVGDRFLDTLIGLARVAERTDPRTDNSGGIKFQVSYALDCPGPVALARSCLATPEVIAIDATGESEGPASGKSSQAWLVHVSPADVIITEMTAGRRTDGKLAARIQLVQTRPKSSRVKLQFCVFAHAAFIADPAGIDRPLEELPQDVTCEDGEVTLTIGNHQAVDLIVVFDV